MKLCGQHSGRREGNRRGSGSLAIPSLEVLVLRVDSHSSLPRQSLGMSKESQNWVRSGSGDFRPVEGRNLRTALKVFPALAPSAGLSFLDYVLLMYATNQPASF